METIAAKSGLAEQRAQKKAARRAAFIQEVAQAVAQKLVPVIQTLAKLDKHEGYLKARKGSLDLDQYKGHDTERSWQLVEEGEQAVAAIKQELADLIN